MIDSSVNNLNYKTTLRNLVMVEGISSVILVMLELSKCCLLKLFIAFFFLNILLLWKLVHACTTICNMRTYKFGFISHLTCG